jgi:hypothetical protein
MCVDFAIHDTDSGNPHCHIMLTMRPLDGRGAWAAKSKKEYDLDENGERIRLPSGRYKTHKVDLTGWNDKPTFLSCATMLFAQGVPMKEIQAWLGHSTIGTTANIYTHLDENSKINSANAIIGIFAKKEGTQGA